MGIKNVRTATYVSDTGKEFQLAEMTSSHIINVIAHHTKQLEALMGCPQTICREYIDIRIADMRMTINELYIELATRAPSKDDEISPRSGGFRDGY
jgi:hypothetical protein